MIPATATAREIPTVGESRKGDMGGKVMGVKRVQNRPYLIFGACGPVGKDHATW
jgi:hypothetical protein